MFGNQMENRISIFNEDREQLIASRLNTFLFQKVWNEPLAEFRNNVIPMVLSERTVSGHIRVYGKDILLPNRDNPFYLYAASKVTMYGVSYPIQLESKWIRCDDLVNQYGILVHVYHTSGRMLPKQACYIYKLKNGRGYLLAVNKIIADNVITFQEKNDLRITVYFDSDYIDKIHIYSFSVPMQDSKYDYRYEIIKAIQECKHTGIDHVQIFIDGYETKIVDIGTFTLGSYVEIVHDENIKFAFDVDLTSYESDIGFHSDLDKIDKQLVHIPKEFNPDNKVYTHNTMDIYVRKKHPEPNGSIKGLFLHRCADRSVTQVTHNDIAIPLYIIDAYRDYLETPDVTLHVVVREQSKDNVLIRDKNYIDLLYTLDDELIIKHLTGKDPADNELTFWSAPHLEESVYIQSMFDVPNTITPSNMTYYIEGLGYYHIMSLLTEKINSVLITEWFDAGYAFFKPHIYQGSPVYPLVYINGRKVDNDYITYDDLSDLKFSVGFTDNYKVSVGSVMTVEMFLDGNTNVYRFTPEEGNNYLDVPYGEFDVIEEIDNGLAVCNKFDRSTTFGYVPFTDINGNIVAKLTDTGKCRISFGPRIFGRTFIIHPVQRVYRYKKDLTEMINKGDPLILDLDVIVNGKLDDKVPVWNTKEVLVYLNGKYLVEGIDYTVQEVLDYKRNLAMKLLVIQNASYLDSKKNVVEYFITSAHEENKKSGFLVGNTFTTSDQEIALCFPQMSIMHVDGYTESDIINEGFKFRIPEDKYRQGAVCELRTSIPKYIAEYLSRYHINDDLERIEILNRYFYGIGEKLPKVVLLNDSHIEYSVYTATIIRDILDGNKTDLSYDPDLARMRDQIKQYDYIAEIDLVTNKKYDLRFIDVSPHYRQFVVNTPDTRKVLQAFIKITMPEDDYISNKQDIDIFAP